MSTKTVTSPLMLDETGKKIATALQVMAAAQAGQFSGDVSWETVQQLVRSGLAERSFPVGTQFTTRHTVYGDVVWDVVAHDLHHDPAGRYAHSMTLYTHDCPVLTLQYDGAEALYCAASELSAGTYHFTLPAGYELEYGGGKTMQFTLTKPVPAGGVLVFPWGYRVQSTAVQLSSYSSQASTTAIETVPVAEGSGGVGLGTADGSGVLNHVTRLRYGSNNWRESAMRQFLNSDREAGEVWMPQTDLDRPPKWVETTAGWMRGLEPEFCAVVGPVLLTTQTNSVCEVQDALGSSYTTQDRFWMPSRGEVFGTGADGAQLPYYADSANTDRVKYGSNGAARNYWLRTPYAQSASNVFHVHSTGSQYYNAASDAYAVAVACAIY